MERGMTGLRLLVVLAFACLSMGVSSDPAQAKASLPKSSLRNVQQNCYPPQRQIIPVFSTDGNYILSNSDDRTLRLWDIETGNVVQTYLSGLEDLSGEIEKADISPDNKYVVAIKDSGWIVLWNARTGERLYKTPYDEDIFPWFNVDFSPNSKYFLVSDERGGHLFNTSTGVKVRFFPTEFQIHGGQMAYFSPDSRYVLTEGLLNHKHTVTLWDVQTGKAIRYFESQVRGRITPDGKYLITEAHTEPVLTVWNMQGFRKLRTISADEIDWFTLSPDSKYIAAQNIEHALTLWNIATGAKVLTFDADPGRHWEIFPDGKRLLIDDEAVEKTRYFVWDIAANKEVHAFSIDDRPYRWLTSPNGKYLVTTSGDEPPRLYDIQTGKKLREFC
jgi:WD40 repeat protein